MENNQDNLFQDTSFSSFPPSFQKKFQDLLGNKTESEQKRQQRFLMGVSLVGIGVGLFGAMKGYFSQQLPPALSFLIVTLSTFTCLSFMIFFGQLFVQHKQNKISPRKQEQISLFLLIGFFFILYFFYFLYALVEKFSLETLYFYGNALLFFWTATMTIFLWKTNHWNQESFLLEQKRTQLELSLLREEFLSRRQDEPRSSKT